MRQSLLVWMLVSFLVLCVGAAFGMGGGAGGGGGAGPGSGGSSASSGAGGNAKEHQGAKVPTRSQSGDAGKQGRYGREERVVLQPPRRFAPPFLEKERRRKSLPSPPGRGACARSRAG